MLRARWKNVLTYPGTTKGEVESHVGDLVADVGRSHFGFRDLLVTKFDVRGLRGQFLTQVPDPIRVPTFVSLD